MAEQQNGGMKPNQNIVREATKQLDDRLNGGVALTDKDLRTVAISAVKVGDAAPVGGLQISKSSPINNQFTPPSPKLQRGALTSDIFNTNPGNRDGNPNSSTTNPKVHHLPPIDSSNGGNVSGAGEADLSSLIVNTSKRQRKILAEREWSKMAESDRINAKVMDLKEREDHINLMAKQRDKLDGQKRELDQKREEERQMRERQKQQMNDHISMHKQLSLKEQQDARNKALEERRIREHQHQEASEARERTRQQEYDDQMRRLMIINEQQRAQKEADLNMKKKKQSEWRDVLHQNEDRTRDKLLQKENTKAEDRDYQRKYKENQERLEAERAAFYARKDARQKHYLDLADRVAEQFNSKDKGHLDKIQSEYDAQLKNEQEDEANRKRTNKQRMADCLNYQQVQIAEKNRQEEQRKADERRQAEEMRQQILDNQRQEHARKMAQHQEQLRMRQFLNTQLQMAHYKETQEPETSIMRPPHVAATMFNTANIRSTSRLSEQAK
eukprot:GILJ01017077.1.p1 GENE.GILJ01017077.1~~GILJ01017077.1.p1  ORF type:complete len:507 (+),score=120.88 GILJ01017077.1:26-1522(+)